MWGRVLQVLSETERFSLSLRALKVLGLKIILSPHPTQEGQEWWELGGGFLGRWRIGQLGRGGLGGGLDVKGWF